MSAPRPFETDPFHPHSSVRILLLGLLEYIDAKVFQLFLPCGMCSLSKYVVH